MDNSSDMDSEDEMGRRDLRRVYLVTYGQLWPEESEGHLDLNTSKGPATINAHVARHRSRKTKVSESLKEREGNDEECIENDGTTDECQPKKQNKRKRLSAFEFSQIIVEKGLKNRTDALAFAFMQKNEGKTDLAEFIINRGVKTVNEAIATAWEMEGATSKQLRTAKSRLQILEEAANEPCQCEPVLQWKELAVQLLKNNGIAPESFANAMKELLHKGRGKYRNIMLTGPENCGKTFLLNPLNKIYKTFTNPASTSFPWVGAEEAEIVFLNYFRWSQQIIAWHDLLLMLEGQLVHLPAPKSHFAKDTVFDSDTPILATSKHQLVFVKNGAIDERETEMMTVRWKVFNFNRQIPQAEQQKVTVCPPCFANLILEPTAKA